MSNCDHERRLYTNRCAKCGKDLPTTPCEDDSGQTALGILANHNAELSRTSMELLRDKDCMRLQLQSACDAIGEVIESAEPIAEQNAEHPQEYVIPVESLHALQAVVTVARFWGDDDGHRTER